MGKASRHKKERRSALDAFNEYSESRLHQSSWCTTETTHNCRPADCIGTHYRDKLCSACHPLRPFVCRCGKEWTPSDHGWRPK